MAWLDVFKNFVTGTLSLVLTNVVVATIILFLGFIIGRVMGNLSKRILGEFGMNRFIYSFIGLRFSIEDIISASLEYFTYFMAIVLALNQIRAGELVFNAIAFFIMFFLLFSIFLSIRDFIPNMMAAIVINSRHLVKKGDYVKIDGIEGRVVETTFHAVKIEIGKKEIVYIPNRTVIKNKIVRIERD